MLQVARLAPKVLEGASDRVAEYLASEFNPDGGVRDRSGRSDLYYTVFGLEGLIALRRNPPAARVRPFLERFGDGGGLDLVHLACLTRCWAALPRGSLEPSRAGRLAERLLLHRAADGAFASAPGAARGAVYPSFLAAGALQDLGAGIPEPERLARAIAALALPDGSFPNEPGVPAGTTPTTAAGVALLRQLGHEPPPGTARWLLERAHPKGGFVAAEGTPLPDLLSTATALHALAGLKAPLAAVSERTLDFLDTLWTGRAFCGTWADAQPDSEYTYYALLSLGHLSLA